MKLSTFKYRLIDELQSPITKNWLLTRKPLELIDYSDIEKQGVITHKFKTIEEVFEFKIKGKKVKEYIEDENYKMNDFTMLTMLSHWDRDNQE